MYYIRIDLAIFELLGHFGKVILCPFLPPPSHKKLLQISFFYLPIPIRSNDLRSTFPYIRKKKKLLKHCNKTAIKKETDILRALLKNKFERTITQQLVTK